MGEYGQLQFVSIEYLNISTKLKWPTVDSACPLVNLHFGFSEPAGQLFSYRNALELIVGALLNASCQCRAIDCIYYREPYSTIRLGRSNSWPLRREATHLVDNAFICCGRSYYVLDVCPAATFHAKLLCED